MLPVEAEPDIVWALQQLRENRLPQAVILTEFNERLADRGIPPIGRGAWSRYSLRKSVQFKRLDEVQKISRQLVQQIGTGGPDQATVMIGEMIKTAAFQMLEDGDIDSKSLMELAHALSGTVGAQKKSSEHRRRLEDSIRAKIDEAIEDAGTSLGQSPVCALDSKAILKRIREEVYGIFDQ
ncbi:phage protein Gp27 family protein [Novosphingobium aquimarinum]|uniref:phage protein Gp27 family protein n=1 Tax=Novosphingobium aquimarinum TaxID=2682494 RepID=UPI0018DBCB90